MNQTNPSPYLAWWTSIETDLRKSLLVGARRDTERLHDLLRTAFEAGRCSATPPSPSTAPEVLDPEKRTGRQLMDQWNAGARELAERDAFEAWARDPIRAEKLPLDRWPANGAYKDTRTYIAFYGWKSGRAALASSPAEVDDEGLPPLKMPDFCAGDLESGEPVYTAEQFRQGQRDAVAADRARREVGGKIPRESNDALIKLAKYWKLDGDWMTCRGCRRSLIASRDGEELNHGDGCKFWDQHHPWAQLRELIAQRPAPAETTP